MNLDTCTQEFADLTRHLEGLQCDGNPVVMFRNPLGLQNWTFPAIEALLVVGALACLVHAVRWYRARGDASNLVVWVSLVSALILIEPVTYFPQWFGLDDKNLMGLTFAHGQFSVQFLFDRLPLYIVAMYPMFGYVAYALVQRTGILQARRPFVGSVAVAFTFFALFEVIDTVGPQWGWWVWNRDPELKSSDPALGPIPYMSLQLFSMALPFAVAYMTMRLNRIPHRGGWFIVRDVVLVSVLVWPVWLVTLLPDTVLSFAGTWVGMSTHDATHVARLLVSWFMIGMGLVVTGWAFWTAYRARGVSADAVPSGVAQDYFVLVCGVVYLAFGLAFWIPALPEHFRVGVGGVTSTGQQSGSLLFGAAAWLCSAALLLGAYLRNGLGSSVVTAASRSGGRVVVRESS